MKYEPFAIENELTIQKSSLAKFFSDHQGRAQRAEPLPSDP